MGQPAKLGFSANQSVAMARGLHRASSLCSASLWSAEVCGSLLDHARLCIAARRQRDLLHDQAVASRQGSAVRTSMPQIPRLLLGLRESWAAAASVCGVTPPTDMSPKGERQESGRPPGRPVRMPQLLISSRVRVLWSTGLRYARRPDPRAAER